MGKELEKKVGWRVVYSSPDGRFGTKTIEGGLDKKSAEFEAKRLKEMGQIVNVFPPKQTQDNCAILVDVNSFDSAFPKIQ